MKVSTILATILATQDGSLAAVTAADVISLGRSQHA